MPVRKRKRHRDYTSRLARQAGVDATEQTSRVFAPEGKRLPDIAEPLIYSQPLMDCRLVLRLSSTVSVTDARQVS